MKLRYLMAAGLVGAGVLVALTLREREPTRSEYCVADVAGVRTQIDLEQAQWTSLMAAIGQRRGLPPRATTIAIATAFQESKIHNIDYGDRDSIGLFQQRPSQGWGTVEQIMDPVYSIGKFYDGLVKVKGYENLEITDAAQRVQRSAFPEAYAQHETRSRALASALRGFSPAAFSCQLNPRGSGSLTAIADDVDSAFGGLASARHDDRLVFPLTGEPADIEARGWALAHYLVANAARLQVTEVLFDGRSWSVSESHRGWIEAGGGTDSVRVDAR